MDGQLAVAYIGAAGGVLGGFIMLWGKVLEWRGARDGHDVDREKMVDEKIWNYVKRLEERDKEWETQVGKLREEHSAELTKVRREHGELQVLYRETAERVESLEMDKLRDRRVIAELTERIGQLEARP